MYKIASITLENFKSHEKDTYTCGQLTEIFGDNRTGKTSVLEAIEFLFNASKKDMNKIRLGSEVATVHAVFESKDSDPVTIETSINKKGTLRCSVKLNGISQKQPKAFLKQFTSVGSFDPRELLGKNRTKYLTNLIPIKITMEDVKHLPISDSCKEEIDFEDHAMEVLKQVDRDLRNTRHSLFVIKDMNKKSYEDLGENLRTHTQVFEKKYGSVSSVISGVNYDKKKGSLEGTREEKKIRRAKVAKDNKVLLDSFTEISDKLEELKEIEKRKKELENKLSNLKITMSENSSEIDSIDSDLSNIEKEITETVRQAEIAKDYEILKLDEKRLKEKENVSKESEEKWKKMDSVIKEDFKKTRNEILSILEKKVPGLKVSDEGEFSLDEKSIDELSESETVSLAIKLMSLDSKGSFICIDGAESLDKKTIFSTEWGDKSVILSRVSDAPLGDGWTSHHLKEKKNV